MIFRTAVRDCLLLSWALPERALAPLPPPLRYELHGERGDLHAVAAALLFFHEGFRLAALPLLRFSYPQFSLALAVLDGHGTPSLYFRRVLLPGWLMPAARLVPGPPVSTARLSFDRPSEKPDAEGWRWTVEHEECAFQVEARPAAPAPSPFFRSWDASVRYFLQRRNGYFQSPKGFRRIEACLPQVEACPVSARLSELSLLETCMPLEGGAPWPELSTAMLFPELPLELERSLMPQVELSHRMPQPAPSRRSALCL